MNKQETRDWPDVSDEHLDDIIANEPNKRIVRIAIEEKKRRQPPEHRPVQTNTRQSETASRVEVVGINLSFRDWFIVIFKAYLAFLCVCFVLFIPLCIIYVLFLRWVIGALI
jgi:hypothetical protein